MSDRLILCAASSDDYVLFSPNTNLQPVIYPSDSPGLEARLDTAARYREEAVRWHDIACQRETKPVPGESLITDNW